MLINPTRVVFVATDENGCGTDDKVGEGEEMRLSWLLMLSLTP